jgi:acetyl-CoA carboxylase biotin carboxyl carrier protein
MDGESVKSVKISRAVGGSFAAAPVIENLTENAAQNLKKAAPNAVNFAAPEAANEVIDGNVVAAPLVGTFYSSSAPGQEPFVSIGSVVKKGDTLCIVEAMKVMNEILSDFDGSVAGILVKDGDMVEHGQPLIRIV